MDGPMMVNVLSDADRLRLKKLAKTGKREQSATAPLVELATDSDAACRQASVAGFLEACSPDVLLLLARRLGELFARDRVPIRRRAAASLLQLGAPAAPALVLAFMVSRRPVIQQQAVELLGKIGQNLSLEQRGELLGVLDQLLPEALDSSIRQTLTHVMARLSIKCIRIARERATQAGTDNGQGPAEEQEWPGEVADGWLGEPAGAQAD